MNSEELIETVKIEDGQIFNIEWHDLRLNQSRKELFGVDKPINLQDYIKPPIEKGVFRCRILYNKEILSIEYIPYQTRKFKKFKIVQSDIDYRYKYANRVPLEKLKAEAFPYDEIIIERDGLLTDTTIANIAFYDGESWLTPKKPLLKGTMRENLLNNNRLIEKDIKSEKLKHFSHFALMNAMIGFQIQKNIIIQNRKEKLCL
jgi:4-amino-4-deoxychorismate lyase